MNVTLKMNMNFKVNMNLKVKMNLKVNINLIMNTNLKVNINFKMNRWMEYHLNPVGVFRQNGRKVKSMHACLVGLSLPVCFAVLASSVDC